LRKLAFHIEPSGQVWIVGNILPKYVRQPEIRNLLEVEKVVVKCGNYVDCAETAVKVTVKALRRRRCGYDECAARRRGRSL